MTKQLENPFRLITDSFHGTKQRSLLVKHLAAVRTESSRNIKCLFLDERIAGRVPCGIATGFKRSPQTTGRERGCIRFTFDQLLARKTQRDIAVFRRIDK